MDVSSPARSVASDAASIGSLNSPRRVSRTTRSKLAVSPPRHKVENAS